MKLIAEVVPKISKWSFLELFMKTLSADSDLGIIPLATSHMGQETRVESTWAQAWRSGEEAESALCRLGPGDLLASGYRRAKQRATHCSAWLLNALWYPSCTQEFISLSWGLTDEWTTLPQCFERRGRGGGEDEGGLPLSSLQPKATSAWICLNYFLAPCLRTHCIFCWNSFSSVLLITTYPSRKPRFTSWDGLLKCPESAAPLETSTGYPHAQA